VYGFSVMRSASATRIKALRSAVETLERELNTPKLSQLVRRIQEKLGVGGCVASLGLGGRRLLEGSTTRHRYTGSKVIDAGSGEYCFPNRVESIDSSTIT
jgi:hypothetical protein